MDTNNTFFSSISVIDPPVELPPNDRIQFYKVCTDVPPKVISDGIWASDTTGASPLQYSFTVLELQIITIFLVTQSFHFFLKRLGFPGFVSQVMAGFVLGPSIPLGPFNKYKKMLFPYGSPDILNTISSFGYEFFMFLTAVKMDFTMITRTGKKAWVIALTSLLTPIAVGFVIMNAFGPFWNNIIGIAEAKALPVVVISHSGCSFAVVASLLADLGILNSELGRLALSSALVCDLSSGIVAGIGTAIRSRMANGLVPIVINLVSYLAYLTLIPLIGRSAMRWVVRQTPEGRPVNKIYLYAIFVTVLLLGFLGRLFYQPFVVGTVLLGLAVPEGPPLGSEFVYQLDLFSTWFFLPIFVTSCTMKVDLTLTGTPTLVAVISCFIVMVHLIKLLLCLGIGWFCGMPTGDGFCLALIMSCKGVVEICSFTLVYDALIQSEKAIGVMIISVLILGTISRIGMKSLYDPSRIYAGYQKRNIMNLKPGSELRLVACIHKPSHIIPIKSVLELYSPTPEKALVADVVHLMELVGRTTPIFISHRLQHAVGSSFYNYSGDVIVSFDLFEHGYAGSVTVNTYTAISPVTLMHEDICHLALDKLASLIILPFHIRWTVHGSVESEDNNIRSLNSKVLERAPCSIGILVNRGFPASSTQRPAHYQIVMIFFGGADDREALCFAKRLAIDSSNSLFVYRLLAYDHDSANWEHMIDDEVIREVRGPYNKLENVTYEEKRIEDASQTTSFLKDIASKFDFIIVGRRNGVNSSQTATLENWTEFRELGVVGDLLASPDMKTEASILVVQQQTTTMS